MGFKEEKAKLEALRTKMFAGGMKIAVFGSSEYHLGKLKKAKNAKDFESTRKERLKELAEGEKLHGDQEGPIKEYKAQFERCKSIIESLFAKVKQTRAQIAEFTQFVEKYNKGVAAYNKEWTTLKKRPLYVMRDYTSELNAMEKPFLQEKEWLDGEAKLLPDLDSDFKLDEKLLKEAKTKVKNAKFPLKK